MAWRIDGKHSGIAVMSGDTEQVGLVGVSSDVTSLSGVIDFIETHSPANAVVAIDAPLVVTNATGQRECERLITGSFGRFHAGCHPSNLSHSHTTTGGRVVSELEKRGFRHDFNLARAKERKGRWIFEVYPHPAMVQLFRLERVIRYKKGHLKDKQRGLAVLKEHLRDLASGPLGWVESPELTQVLERDPSKLFGQALKRFEDTLDAIFCAYLAWYCWRWGEERNEIFGTLVKGYIVVPRRLGASSAEG
jgi:predicted RNase H-like nuclease